MASLRSRRAHRALVSMLLFLAAGPAAAASTGGFGLPGSGEPPTPEASTFGSRVLRTGMTGPDVRVLNAIVRSKPYGSAVALGEDFQPATRRAVRRFQGLRGLPATGVVDRTTARTLARSMRSAGATWYGPGLYGNTTACGQVLRRGTIGLAHKTLPCGTVVAVAYRGRYLVARVIDRGPYHEGYSWDITNGARHLLGFEGAEDVRYAVAR